MIVEAVHPADGVYIRLRLKGLLEGEVEQLVNDHIGTYARDGVSVYAHAYTHEVRVMIPMKSTHGTGFSAVLVNLALQEGMKK